MATGAPSTDLLQIDDQLNDEERLIRDTVRAFAGDRVLPHVEDWFEEGTLPRDHWWEGGFTTSHLMAAYRDDPMYGGGR